MGQEIRTVNVKSWADLVQQLDALSNCVFRGQRSAEWDLRTTLDRHSPGHQARFLSEAELLREFRRRAHNYVSAHEMPSTTGEWLALMQHHGAPTRLLDVTRSPYVAAYFALEDPPPGGTDHCAIWAIDTPLCARRSGAEVLKNIPTMPAAVERAFELTSGVIDRETIAAMHLSRPLHEQLHKDKIPSIGIGNPAVLPYEPQTISDRMSVQQGLFVVPWNIELSFMDNLHAVGAADAVTKIVVSSSLVRGRALEQLRLMNITRASLFRGLDGFAQSFRQLLVKETREQRAIRSLQQGLLTQRTPEGSDQPVDSMEPPPAREPADPQS